MKSRKEASGLKSLSFGTKSDWSMRSVQPLAAPWRRPPAGCSAWAINMLLLLMLTPAFAGDNRGSATQPDALGGAQTAPARLHLVVVEGEGAINNVKQRTTRPTVVEVEDENHKPVAGAVVVFLLPHDGPGGSFLDGTRSATVLSDGRGLVMSPRMQINQWEGRFEIRVHASFQGLQADLTVMQTNVAGSPAPAARAGLSAKAIAILAGVAVAGAAGAAVGLHGGGKPARSAPAAPSAPSLTISLGGGAAFGSPH